MLSICIPIYNVDIIKLVTKLHSQASNCQLNFEIRLYDDGSSETYKNTNRAIKKLNNVVLLELPNNLGSAAIRNKLLRDSKYNNILFLDSDSDIEDDYIKKYVPYLYKNQLIICGGRVHPKVLPSKEYSLRWTVGIEREDYNAQQRKQCPNKSFMSNNFMVKKQLFDIVSFNEKIQRSGHEDTMYGIELEKKGINIEHFDNPVTHIGLETNKEFIHKTRQRIDTLNYLAKQNTDELIYRRITLLGAHRKLKFFNLLFRFIYLFGKNMLETHLQSKKPNMRIYDLYKISYLSTLS